MQVLLSIDAFNDARVRAMLIDRHGQRTGWNVDRPIREIPGVVNGYGTEDGIPDENAPPDTTTLAPTDTIPGHSEPTPRYYYLSIQESSGGQGLLQDGACELRLDPEVSGHVSLALTGSGIGIKQCQDTTSVNVRPGTPSRWRLAWSLTNNECSVKITPIIKGKAANRNRVR